MTKFLRLLGLPLCFFSVFCFSTELKDPQDVHSTIEKLVSYHVDTKEITADILSTSVEEYAKIFDTNKAYLTQQEVLFPIATSESRRRLLKNYRANEFSAYHQLDTSIQNSILRARVWRSSWASDSEKLVQEARSKALHKRPKVWASSIQEVKDRQHHLLLSYIALHLSDGDSDRYRGKEQRLVQLCIKQIENHENIYLGVNGQGHALSQEEKDKLLHARIVKAVAHSLDAHTDYFSKEEALAMRVQLEKGMCGIGIVLKEDIEGVTIREILHGGPAEKSGQLIAGDIISHVDGQDISDVSFTHVLEILRGAPGSSVTLKIRRGDNSRTVHLKREKIFLEDRRVDVSYEPYGDGVIGKITLHSFYEGDNNISSEQDLRDAIQELKAKNLLGLVLDIRENTGGFLSQAIKVSGLFMTNGVVVVSRYADGSIKRYRTISPQKFYNGPLAILVSKSSASAAEIVAHTLQDYGVGIIVGDEQTYGKGTIQHQTITGNANDDFFKVTVGKYYAPSGQSPQLQGVKSDIVISSRYAEDPLGERFLEHPLPSDRCDNVLSDNLQDLDTNIRPWFQKYYLPNLQKQEEKWRSMLPQLIANSKQRLENNLNYNHFLSSLKHSNTDQNYGSNDLQMEESVNIVKDMIVLARTRSLNTENP